jgi:hypothetical protein
MKKITVAVFLIISLMVLAPLAAQSVLLPAGYGYDYDGRAIVCVLPFVGEDDAASAFNQATFDAVKGLQKYSSRKVSVEELNAVGVRIPTDMPPVRELTPGARYALTGGVYPGNYDHEHYIQLWLWDMTSSTMIYSDDLVFEDIAESLETLPGLVEWLFSHIIEVVQETEPVIEKGWQDKFINVGLRSGLPQRWYLAAGETSPGAHALNFEGGILASVLINSLLSFQMEIDFTWDNVVYRGISSAGGGGGYSPVASNKKYTSFSMTFPFFIKANFKPGNFRIAPFAGLYAFAPLGKASYQENPSGKKESFSQSVDFPMGFIGGLEGAMKFGPGMIIADVRYLGDFGTITIHDADRTAYNRRMVSVTLGYAIGFIDMKGQGGH